MKQVLQNLSTGETTIEDVPVPVVSDGQVLIRTSRTLVSAGTERMLVEFGKGNLLQKARQQPDKVRQALQKAMTDGVLPTAKAIKDKLAVPLPLGYCNVGIAIESRVPAISVGERLVSNGHHAEIVAVSKNLCAKVPDAVDDDTAAFTVIGAIALQGIRLIAPTLGETVVVTGLGLIGLVAVQLLRAHGCRVLGIDFDGRKLAIVGAFGAETVDLANGQDVIAAADSYSRGRGVDAVLITASTSSNIPIRQAAVMCRKRGRIVLVGVVGMEMSRADFYEKELTFQVSCSYGPGRHEQDYEHKGYDYPFGYVRWTEQRNLEAVLDLMADGRLDMTPLISHRFSLADAPKAYQAISSGSPLGVLLDYDQGGLPAESGRVTRLYPDKVSSSKVVVGFVGAGAYASSILVPAFAQAPARLKAIASVTGVSSVYVGKRFSFEEAVTGAETLLEDSTINTLVIATRHDSHAVWVINGLKHGKHVFVEKPLALTKEELAAVTSVYEGLTTRPVLMVGFNRRYAPHIRTIKSLLSFKRHPISFMMTVNAGAIPKDHWTQDRSIGGGRIIGECCHFVDLLRYLAGHPIAKISALAIPAEPKDSVMIQLSFADGSIGTISYLANGNRSYPKERLEVFCAGSVLRLDNFRTLKGYGWPGFRRQKLWVQDKGQASCVRLFVEAIAQGNAAALIPFNELIEVANACFEIEEQVG